MKTLLWIAFDRLRETNTSELPLGQQLRRTPTLLLLLTIAREIVSIVTIDIIMYYCRIIDEAFSSFQTLLPRVPSFETTPFPTHFIPSLPSIPSL